MRLIIQYMPSLNTNTSTDKTKLTKDARHIYNAEQGTVTN
jgi:hypothetical protein